jgi:hypothetical protein
MVGNSSAASISTSRIAVCGAGRAVTAASSANQCTGWILQSAFYDCLYDGQSLVGIGFAGRILKQPFENHARIEHHDHGPSAARARRISSRLGLTVATADPIVEIFNN